MRHLLWILVISHSLFNYIGVVGADDVLVFPQGDNNATRREILLPRRLKKGDTAKSTKTTKSSPRARASPTRRAKTTSQVSSRTSSTQGLSSLSISSELFAPSYTTPAATYSDLSASINAFTSGLSYRLSATMGSRFPIQELWFIVTRPSSRRFRRTYQALRDSVRGPDVYYVDLVDLDPGTYKWSAKAHVIVDSMIRVEYSPQEYIFEIIQPRSQEPSSSPSVSSEIATLPPPTISPVTLPPVIPGSTSAPEQTSSNIRYGLQDDCKFVDTTKFNICLDLKSESGEYETWMDAFALARDRWQEIITDDGDSPIDIRRWFPPADIATELPTIVDDLYVSCSAVKIDGPGRILGMAGPLVIKNSNGNRRPLGGVMQFDIDDIKSLDDEEWKAVILHELGHVLGIGTLFSRNGLHSGRPTSDSYTGANAEAEWQKLCPGGRLPIETDGSPGTAGGHWDESCLRGELMTGYLSSNAMQLSRISIASLKDMGYGVDMSAADEYTTANLGDCGIYCPRQPRNLRQSPYDKRKERVSEEGHREILAAAAKELQRHRTETPTELPEGLVYVAAESISVFIRDFDGFIKEESVTFDEVQDHITRTATNVFDHQ